MFPRRARCAAFAMTGVLIVAAGAGCVAAHKPAAPVESSAAPTPPPAAAVVVPPPASPPAVQPRPLDAAVVTPPVQKPTAPLKRPAAATTAPKKSPAVAAAPPAPVQKPAAAPTLNLSDLEQRLRDTSAIGVFTKLSLKNQVDDLLNDFRTLYKGAGKQPPPELRQRYDSLLAKVLGLLQSGDPKLASAIASSREAIWGILADPDKFSKI
jgi:hypothetical protein